MLEALDVAVTGGPRPMLEPTSLRLATGEIVVATGEPGHGHTALALALAGRLVPDHGSVTIDGDSRLPRLQAEVACVDVPGVSEPDENLPLRSVIDEDLTLAGRRTGRRAVWRWARDHGAESWVPLPMEAVPAEGRARLLAELAAERRGVRFVILTLPDRFGGTPDTWLAPARELASRGFGVLVTTTPLTAERVDLPTVAMGSEQP